MRLRPIDVDGPDLSLDIVLDRRSPLRLAGQHKTIKTMERFSISPGLALATRHLVDQKTIVDPSVLVCVGGLQVDIREDIAWPSRYVEDFLKADDPFVPTTWFASEGQVDCADPFDLYLSLTTDGQDISLKWRETPEHGSVNRDVSIGSTAEDPIVARCRHR